MGQFLLGMYFYHQRNACMVVLIMRSTFTITAIVTIYIYIYIYTSIAERHPRGLIDTHIIEMLLVQT